MKPHTPEEWQEAQRAIESMRSKCEKALLKLKPGTSSHTLTRRRIAAFHLALELLKENQPLDPNNEPHTQEKPK